MREETLSGFAQWKALIGNLRMYKEDGLMGRVQVELRSRGRFAWLLCCYTVSPDSKASCGCFLVQPQRVPNRPISLQGAVRNFLKPSIIPPFPTEMEQLALCSNSAFSDFRKPERVPGAVPPDQSVQTGRAKD